MTQVAFGGIHHSSLVMFCLLVLFAVIHSGGAAMRTRAESLMGARAWRLIFAAASIPSAVLLIAYFLAHRYDGIRLWNLQGFNGVIPFVWLLSAISFLFLYPATYNLLEIPALLKPQVRLYATGIIRVSRHPQAIGQILWCFTHALWLGTSFTLLTCFGLIAHHAFAIWHGDRRMRARFGESFETLRDQTSVIPFLAIFEGRQKLLWKEFLRPSQLGIAIAVFVIWWAHRYIPLATKVFLSSRIGELLS